MQDVLNDRIVKFKDNVKNIVFDISTNRVVVVENDNSEELESVFKILTQYHDNANHQVLKGAKYEDGSNLAININLTPACNLKCVYCFAQGGDYGSLEKPMDVGIIESLDYLIRKYKTDSNKVRLEFFGGEPLLNFKVIKEIVEYTKSFSKKENVDFIYRISTNLTFLNDEMLNLLGENNFIISISIDGGKEVQDSQRPFKNDDGSFDAIIRNIELIREKYKHLILVARMTIAQKEHSVYENIKKLISTDYYDYVSIYPASIKDEKNSNNKYVYYFDEDIKAQIDCVIRNYENLFKISQRFKGILEYEKIYDQILNGKLSINHCSAGGTYFTLSGDKSVVPCHRVCGKDKFILNSNSESLNTDILDKWTTKVDQHKTCSQCWVRYICGGGCKQEHLSANGDISYINLNSCEYHKFIIEKLILSIDNFSEQFNKRVIDVGDLFVYCGRPTVSNHRSDDVIVELNKIAGVKVKQNLRG